MLGLGPWIWASRSIFRSATDVFQFPLSISLLNRFYEQHRRPWGYGGIFINPGGATLNFKNTIIVGNRGSSIAPDCGGAGTLNSQDFNLSGDSTGCTITGTVAHNQSGDPRLAPLANNGGPTQTHGLYIGSPAVNNGDDATCHAIDQRGVVRPVGAHCDIGA